MEVGHIVPGLPSLRVKLEDSHVSTFWSPLRGCLVHSYCRCRPSLSWSFEGMVSGVAGFLGTPRRRHTGIGKIKRNRISGVSLEPIL